MYVKCEAKFLNREVYGFQAGGIVFVHYEADESAACFVNVWS